MLRPLFDRIFRDLERLAQEVARNLERAWRERDTPPEGAVWRGWKDTKRVSRRWLYFRAPAVGLTAGFAVWSALLPTKASGFERGVLAVSGTLGGALIVAVLAFAVLTAIAPIKQRNEARRELAEFRVAEQRREAEARVQGSSGRLISRRADGPIETGFLTKEETGREISFGERLVAVRFSHGAYGPSFERVTVREVPTDVYVGEGGVIVVQAFTAEGILIDEENTLGQSVDLKGYTEAGADGDPSV